MTVPVLQNYIDGAFVTPSGTEMLDVISPVDESVVARAPISDAADVDAAMSAAAKAFETWGDTTPGERQLALLKFADALEERAEELADVEVGDTGKPRAGIVAD